MPYQSLPLALTIAHIAKPINAPIISPIIKLIIFFVPLPIFKFYTVCARHIRTVIIVICAILTTHWLIQIIHTYLLPFLNKNAPTNDTALAKALYSIRYNILIIDYLIILEPYLYKYIYHIEKVFTTIILEIFYIS